MNTYPVNRLDRAHAGLDLKTDYRALLTGEFRPPRRGEWYLSGFALDEANRIAALLNADEAAPAPTDEDLALAERCRDAARDQYIEDARVEIDADADVAQSADEQGAFVQAWVWVDAEDL